MPLLTEPSRRTSETPFVELAARSSFSFLQGASHPGELVEHAHEQGHSTLGLCDHNGLYGTARAHARAQDLGSRLLVGATIPLELSPLELASRSSGNNVHSARLLSPNECQQLSRNASENRLRKSWLSGRNYPELLLLAKNATGYQNLCRLLTQAHAELPKGECLLRPSSLGGHTSGLVALLPTRVNPSFGGPSCKGSALDMVPQSLLETLHDCWGVSGNLHSLVYRRLDTQDAQRVAIARARTHRYGITPLASAWPLYHHKSRKPLADILQCIRMGLTLDKACSQLPINAQAYLRSPHQMRRLFADHLDWLENSAQVAAEIDFQLSDLQYQFPCKTPDGKTPDESLRTLTWQGAARRYPEGTPHSVSQQISKELTLIAHLEVASYFLSTLEVVDIARERGILCQGRGSAANSAVCFCLGITAVDPTRSNLLFERFMSAERREPPDIDVDFEHERREEVIQEIYRRHGRERAAMVSEVICYRRKSALREVSKAFGFSSLQTDRLVKVFSRRVSPSAGPKSTGATESQSDALSEAQFDESAERVQGVLTLAEQLEGFPRHLSIHVGGFVLSARPLSEVAPVEPARKEGRSVIPWDKDDMKTLGFFKIDVLALGMLTAIRKAMYQVWKQGGLRIKGLDEPHFDPLEVVTRIPAEDPAVYRLTAQADTVGVFQIESRAQMAMLPRLRPQRFYDLVIEVAIVRPGPIQGGMVHPYLRRRNQEEASTCHPLLKEILQRTLGVPLFQEQVMQIAIVGAGYTGGEADELRRDMAAWKKTGRLQQHEQRLLDGFAKNGIDPRFGVALFKQIQGFGEYGFPESHAASFALLVYQSAWLKAHHPAQFVCALLNSQPMGFYSPSSLVKDAQKHGVVVKEICALRSEEDCTLEGSALRMGLCMVQGLSKKGIATLLKHRAGFDYSKRFSDFKYGLEISQGDFEALAEAGAFHRLQVSRRQALWSVRAPAPPTSAVQLDLFSHLAESEPDVLLPRLQPVETLALDYKRTRLSLEDHPMRHLRAALNKKKALTLDEMTKCSAGQRVRIAGLVLSRQRPATASGVVFITLEDETGIANLILFRQVFEAHRSAAEHSALLQAEGTVERQDPTAFAHELKALRQKGAVASIVHLRVSRVESLEPPGARLHHRSRDFH